MNEDDVVTKYSALVAVQMTGIWTKYNVELIRSLEGYAIGCPTLAGCWSQGNSEEEALTNIADAIKDYLEVTTEWHLPHKRN